MLHLRRGSFNERARCISALCKMVSSILVSLERRPHGCSMTVFSIAVQKTRLSYSVRKRGAAITISFPKLQRSVSQRSDCVLKIWMIVHTTWIPKLRVAERWWLYLFISSAFAWPYWDMFVIFWQWNISPSIASLCCASCTKNSSSSKQGKVPLCRTVTAALQSG